VRSDEGTTVGLAVGCCQGLSHRLIGKLNPAQGGSCAKPVQTRKLPRGFHPPHQPVAGGVKVGATWILGGGTAAK